jgi:threonine/homoserine/homoserine lactone efflux protein
VVAVLSASEPAFRALKLAGAAYLVYLGAQSLVVTLRRRPHGASVREAAPIEPARALRQGVISNLGNPKMAVFFASLLPQFAGGEGASFLALLALGLLFCSLTLAWLTLYAFAVDRLRHFLGGPVRRALDAVTGLVLVALGTRLAAEER